MTTPQDQDGQLPMTKEERDLLARRIVILYHRVLVDIRNWIYEGEVKKAQDAADLLEPLEIDFFCSWLTASKETIYSDIHMYIDWFVKKYNDRQYYHELFDISFEELVKKYLPPEYEKKRGVHKEY